MKKFKIGMDVDSVLFACSEYAVELEQRKRRYNPPLTIDEITWHKSGGRGDVVFEYFKKKSFWKKQPVLPGAHDAIKALVERGHEIIILSAVPNDFMTLRAKRILKEFPCLEKIMLGNAKDIASVDIQLDDSPINIEQSISKYPVVYRRPWNRHIKGHLVVENLEQFVSLVDALAVAETVEVKLLSETTFGHKVA